jgi:ankyrin repeat protein
MPAQRALECKGMTFDAVHKAIKRGDFEAIRKAFDEGLDPDLANKGGWTILMLAAMKGNSRIGELLIDKGADLNKRNTHRDTALSLAALSGSASFVELLLQRGASLDCYPHGNSLDVYLDWLSSFYPERMKRIRKAFDSQRSAQPEGRVAHI